MFCTLRFSSLFFKLVGAMLLIALLVIGMQRAAPASAVGTAYYIDCQGGDDGNSGTSTSAPWRTFANPNSMAFQPGDSILLKRGTLCSGIGSLTPHGSGTSTNPITLGAYGTGALPHIGCGTGSPVYSCVLIKDEAAWVVRDLEVSGIPVDKKNGPAGVYIENTIEGVKSYFRIYNVVAHDLWFGISISGYRYRNGGELYGQETGNINAVLDDVVIDGVEAYNNEGKGIHIVGNYSSNDSYLHNTNVTVRNANLHDNAGDGIVMTATDGGLMEYIVAIHNGFGEDDRYGIWPWNANDITTQFSESAFNETPQNKGGGGLDCDWNVNGCIFQYNYAHDNEGPGQLLIGYGKETLENANIRYNIYVDNCWHATAPDCGDLVVYGTVNNSYYHNNTVYFKNRNNNQGEVAAVYLSTWGKFGAPSNTHIKNNIFYLDNNGRAYWQEVGGSYSFDNNLLYATSGDLRIMWGGTEYSTLAAFQAATGQDLNSAYADPLLVAPGGRDPTDYQIASSSSAVDGGVDLGANLMGSRDYFGNAIPQGAGYDIGAHEAGGGPTPTLTPTPGGPTPTPTDTPAPTTTPTDTPAPTPTATPGGSTLMHVGDIWTTDQAGNPKIVFQRREYVDWHVLILDQNGVPVPGATVTTYTTKSDGSGYDIPANTGDDGVAHWSKKIGPSDPVGEWTIEVISVVKNGATYDPNANVKDTTIFTVQ